MKLLIVAALMCPFLTMLFWGYISQGHDHDEEMLKADILTSAVWMLALYGILYLLFG